MPSSIRTLQAAGRALVVDRERAAALVDGAVVHHGDALRGDPLAEQAGEGRGLLAVEVALQAVADRLVQQDAGPARSEHHGHLAGGCCDRIELDQRLAQHLVHHALPARRLEQAVVAEAAAGAGSGALHARAVADHDADVEPDQRADVAAAHAVRAHDLDLLPGAAERRAHLPDPRILAAGIGVDLLEQCDLVGLVAAADRVGLAVAAPIGAARRQRQRAAVTGLDGADRPDRAAQRRLAQLRAVGAADRLTGDRAQAEPLAGIERGALEPAVVEAEALGLAILEEQLAVVDPVQPFGEQRLEARRLQIEARRRLLARTHMVTHGRFPRFEDDCDTRSAAGPISGDVPPSDGDRGRLGPLRPRSCRSLAAGQGVRL